MVLKGTVVALDAAGGFVAMEEKGSVDTFLELSEYFVGDGSEVLFRVAYRDYVLAFECLQYIHRLARRLALA